MIEREIELKIRKPSQKELADAKVPTAAIEASTRQLTRAFRNEAAVFTTADSIPESAFAPLPEEP